LGNVLDLGVPSDNTVSLAKLTATGTKDATTFLRGDNTFAEVVSGITEFDLFRLTADTSSGSNADITTNLERDDTYSGLDKIGTGMTESSGIFTFPSTGKYEVFVNARMRFTASDQNARVEILVSTDGGSTYNDASYVTQGTVTGGNAYMSASNLKVLNVTNTSNIKVKFATASFDAGNFLTGSTNINLTTFKFTKLGD